MYNWIDKVNWEKVDKVILVTNAKKQQFLKSFPEHESKIVVIPEAVSLSKFHSERKKFNGHIGILCHLTPRKRVYELILTFYELCKLHSDLHLHIGGGEHPRFKDYYEALYSLVDKLNLGDKVTFYGNVTKPEDWYRKIDVFISNSYSEGLQVSPMEAIASGCYCLSHHWDGADELFPPEYLYFTSQELIEKVLCHVERPEQDKWAQIELLQSIVSKNFNIDEIKIQIRELIEEVGAKYDTTSKVNI
jgi:glycosyltransferase involved in cell wall biosynthesis